MMLNLMNRCFCIYILFPLLLSLVVTDAALGEKEIKAFKVEVSLKSGMHCEAVISSKTFLPLLKKNENLDLAKLDPEAQLSLFYLNGLNGKMTVRLKDIDTLRGLKPMSEKNLSDYTDKIKQRIVVSEGKEESRRPESSPEPGQATTTSEGVPPQPEKSVVTKREKKKEEKELEWLKRFPLEEGWKPETKQELYKRGVTLGVYPSEEEQAFLDHYKDWMKDYEIYQERQKESAQEKEEARKEAEKANRTWLERFPVKEGWGAARKEIILRKLNEADIQLSSEEKAFLKHYDEWNAQYSLWRKRNKGK